MRSVQELMSLKGRVALITGAAGHVGSALAETFAELGAAIVLVDKEEKACISLSNSISKEYNTQALPIIMDLGDENALRSLPDYVNNYMKRLDILVNNAALVGTSDLKGWISPFLEQSADTMRLALEINLTVPFILTQIFANMLTASQHGSVINISSIYGVVGPNMSLYEGTNMGNPAAYGASKGGILQLTRWLATTLAPHIRVNAITLGGIYSHQPEVFHERYVKLTPMRRMAIEEDIKGAAAYLASDLSAYVTGHNLVVDGGWTCW